ncbi:hypothetical protein ACFWXO_13640 [Kitasatospora sp. NPDC059088]|uniref:hypothetical protein n=1 Tax=Kitasatospora sp. NPDC059088 TaxID=3346722 RepID=UPI0036A381D7
MSLIIVASAKGSPGASTTALAMASQWPRQSLLAELDPLGSDLLYRQVDESGMDLNPNKGMFSLALPARGVLTPDVVREHTQRLPGGLEVLVGLTKPEQGAGWSEHWDKLGRCLAAPGTTDIIADIGRYHPGAPTAALLRHASLVLLVSRAAPEDLAHVRSRAANVIAQTSSGGRGGAPVGVLVVAPLRQQAKASDMAATVLAQGGVPAQVAGVVAHDADAAERLTRLRSAGRIHKTQLMSSVRHIVSNLGGRFGLGQNSASAVPAPATSMEGAAR